MITNSTARPNREWKFICQKHDWHSNQIACGDCKDEPKCSNATHPFYCRCLNESKEDKTWCEHMKSDLIYDMREFRTNGSIPIQVWGGGLIKFCPICGKPKPKERTLEEKDESQNLFDTKFVQSPEKYSITAKFKKPNKITEKSIKWFCEGCAHYHLIADTVDFKYCSYCGRKRHEQRTKRDILAQKMFDYHIKCKTDAGYEMQALADIAIEFLLGTEE